MKKKFLCIFVAISFIFFSSGCNQKTEMVNLAKVMALGVDINPDGKYLVSIRILTESSSSKSAGIPTQNAGGLSTESAVYSASGNSILDAMNKLNVQLGKEIRFSHSKVIIIGEETAKKSIYSTLDYSLRLYQMRPNIPILISKGTALEIMNIETVENPLPPAAIEDILMQQNKIGYAPYITNLDIANALLTESTAPIIPLIMKNTKETTNTNSFRIEGTAVLKKDKLVGYLNDKETRGLEWVIGNIRLGAIVLPGIKTGSLTTLVIDSYSKINPRLEGNDITIEIDVKNKANIREMTDDLDMMKNPEIMDELNEVQNKIIKTEIEEAINSAQKNLKQDVFGFGQAIYRKYPKEWKKIKDKWSEEFPRCIVKVNVHSNIERPGSLNKPIK